MGMIESGIGALREAQAVHLGVEVAYSRPGGREKTVLAVLGRTVFHSTNDAGAWVRTETRDFIVAAEDMDAPPEAGDEIVFRGETYEVLSPSGEPCWRWSDPYRSAYRIHTKHTGGET